MSKRDSCPRGMIKRKGYTAKRGSKNVRVPASCIKATSASGSKRSTSDKAYLARRARIQKNIRKKYGAPRCRSNEIVREGYTRKGFNRRPFTRKDGTKVKATRVKRAETAPTCVRDVGNVGKGYKIPLVLEKGVLKRAGYDNVKNMSLQDRHTALATANQQIGNPLSLFRKLVVISTMNKNKDPKLAQIFKSDANWVKNNFGLSTARSGSKTSRPNRRSGAKSAKRSTSKSAKRSTRKTTGKTTRKTTARKSARKPVRKSASRPRRYSGSKTSRRTRK